VFSFRIFLKKSTILQTGHGVGV